MNISPEGQRCSVDQNTLKRTDLDDFVNCYFGGKTGVNDPGYNGNRHDRKPTWTEENDKGRWRAYDYEELIKRDKMNLDIFWLKDEALEDGANLPAPEVIAADIDSRLPLRSPFGLWSISLASQRLDCRRPPSRPCPVRRDRE